MSGRTRRTVTAGSTSATGYRRRSVDEFLPLADASRSSPFVVIEDDDGNSSDAVVEVPVSSVHTEQQQQQYRRKGQEEVASSQPPTDEAEEDFALIVENCDADDRDPSDDMFSYHPAAATKHLAASSSQPPESQSQSCKWEPTPVKSARELLEDVNPFDREMSVSGSSSSSSSSSSAMATTSTGSSSSFPNGSAGGAMRDDGVSSNSSVLSSSSTTGDSTPNNDAVKKKRPKLSHSVAASGAELSTEKVSVTGRAAVRAGGGGDQQQVRLDELEYLLDGLGPRHSATVRRHSALQLCQMMFRDEQMLFLIRSRELVAPMMESMVHLHDDETLSYLSCVALALVAREPLNLSHVPLELAQSLVECVRQFHPTLQPFMCFQWDDDEGAGAQVHEAFSMFQQRVDNEPVADEVHVAGLAMFVLGRIAEANVASRKDLLGDTDLLQLCTDLLQMRLARFKEWQMNKKSNNKVVVEMNRSASEDVDNDDDAPVLSLWESRNTFALLDFLTSTGQFEFHLACTQLCTVVSNWLDFIFSRQELESSADDSPNAMRDAEEGDQGCAREAEAALLQGCLRVLINSTNRNAINASRIGETSLLPSLVQWLASQRIAEDTSRGFDSVLLALGLVVNLVEVSPSNRQRLGTIRVAVDDGEDCLPLTALQYLGSLYIEMERNSKKRKRSKETDMESQVLRSYLALVLGLSTLASADNTELVMESLGGSFDNLVLTLEQFRQAQEEAEAMPEESMQSLKDLIQRLSTPVSRPV